MRWLLERKKTEHFGGGMKGLGTGVWWSTMAMTRGGATQNAPATLAGPHCCNWLDDSIRHYIRDFYGWNYVNTDETGASGGRAQRQRFAVGSASAPLRARQQLSIWIGCTFHTAAFPILRRFERSASTLNRRIRLRQAAVDLADPARLFEHVARIGYHIRHQKLCNSFAQRKCARPDS